MMNIFCLDYKRLTDEILIIETGFYPRLNQTNKTTKK
jgi:hypothetical protein